jgi:hypothetical protein
MVTSPSGQAATVAVLDYPGPSTPTRTKSVLLDDERLTCAYPLDTRLPCTTRLAEYASAVAAGLGAPPAVVVAYCGAAPVARELARLLPVRPRLIMVNPRLLTADDGVLALASFLADDADAIGADERRAAEVWLAEGADHDRAMQALTDRHLGRLARQFGSPQPHLRPIAVQLATMQVQWVYHIAAPPRTYRPTSSTWCRRMSGVHRAVLPRTRCWERRPRSSSPTGAWPTPSSPRSAPGPYAHQRPGQVADGGGR